MIDVQMLSFKDLAEEEQENASENGHGKEYACYIKVVHDGKVIALESDAMEKEDAIFPRDLSWIVSLLDRCYELGQEDMLVGEYDPKTGQHR